MDTVEQARKLLMELRDLLSGYVDHHIKKMTSDSLKKAAVNQEWVEKINIFIAETDPQ